MFCILVFCSLCFTKSSWTPRAMRGLCAKELQALLPNLPSWLRVQGSWDLRMDRQNLLDQYRSPEGLWQVRLWYRSFALEFCASIQNPEHASLGTAFSEPRALVPLPFIAALKHHFCSSLRPQISPCFCFRASWSKKARILMTHCSANSFQLFICGFSWQGLADPLAAAACTLSSPHQHKII